MAQGSFRARLAAGCLLASCGTLTAQQQAPPDPAKVLQYRPKQDAVIIATPTPAEVAGCKVEVANGANNTSALVLKDARGQVLRRFADTRGTKKVDTYSFFLDGQEVYREVDTNANTVPDQYRWFGAQGMRWGVDLNEDGRIDYWKQISAEEVSQEILRAAVSRDAARVQALTLREDEIKALELPAAEASKIRETVAQISARFQSNLPKFGVLSDKTRWLHLETQPPQCIAAEASGGKYDVIRYKSGTVVHETGGKAELFQTGEMLQIGKAWRLVSAPAPGSGESETAVGGPTNDAFMSEKARGLVQKLQDLDAKAPKPTDPATAIQRYNLDRAGILEQIAAELKGADADQWIRQIADCLSAAAQSGSNDTVAIRRLADLRERIAKVQPNGPLAGYITFREMSAEYANQLGKAKPNDLVTVQDAWRENLTKFVKDFPTAEDTPDAVLQLAMLSEFSNKETEAKNWYTQLAKNHGDHPLARKAVGALKRLDADGKEMELTAPTIGNGQPFDIRGLNGKVVVVYYWASWNQQCAADFFRLKTLTTAYGAKGLEVVTVNLDNAAVEAQAFLQRAPAPGVHLFQQPGGLDGPLAVNYGVMVTPHIFLVGRDGKVISHTVQTNGLEEEIKRLIEK